MEPNVCNIKGFVKVWLNGKLIQKGQNLITSAGDGLVATLVSGSGTAPSHMAIGAGATTPTATQTALIGTEHERVSTSAAVVDNQLTLTAQFGSGITGSVEVEEIGIFNDASAGTMLARFLTSNFTLSSSDTLDVEWTVAFGDS